MLKLYVKKSVRKTAKVGSIMTGNPQVPFSASECLVITFITLAFQLPPPIATTTTLGREEPKTKAFPS